MTIAAILNLGNVRFSTEQYVLYEICNIPTKFGADWSNSKDMVTVFRNSRWRQPPSWILVNVRFLHDSRVLSQMFWVRFATFPPNLVRIGPIVKKWQLCGGAPCASISTELGAFVGLTDVITYIKMIWKFPMIFPGRQVEKRILPNRQPTAIAMRYRAGLW